MVLAFLHFSVCVSSNHGKLDSKVTIAGGTEGCTLEDVEAVDQDERASQVLPSLGDGVPHLVQTHVELLDDIAIAVPNVRCPRQQEVIGWFPHGLMGCRARFSGNIHFGGE